MRRAYDLASEIRATPAIDRQIDSQREDDLLTLEDQIRTLTAARQGVYPRPWTTDTDPERVDVLIVGASSAKPFRAADVGNHDQFIDALWNRNGRKCRTMYEAATVKPSRTRPNLDRLSEMLTARGFSSLQTNVTCASAPYDSLIGKEDRDHGAEIFKTVVSHVPWKAMIVYGVGACRSFGRIFELAMPPVPSTPTSPAYTTFRNRPVFVSPTLAAPGYRTSVWPYLEQVVKAIPI